MRLFKDLIATALDRMTTEELLHASSCDYTKLVEAQCYQALRKIKAILEDDYLSDAECFFKIEAIICTLEEIGSDGGGRHDFG